MMTVLFILVFVYWIWFCFWRSGCCYQCCKTQKGLICCSFWIGGCRPCSELFLCPVWPKKEIDFVMWLHFPYPFVVIVRLLKGLGFLGHQGSSVSIWTPVDLNKVNESSTNMWVNNTHILIYSHTLSLFKWLMVTQILVAQQPRSLVWPSSWTPKIMTNLFKRLVSRHFTSNSTFMCNGLYTLLPRGSSFLAERSILKI